MTDRSHLPALPLRAAVEACGLTHVQLHTRCLGYSNTPTPQRLTAYLTGHGALTDAESLVLAITADELFCDEDLPWRVDLHRILPPHTTAPSPGP